MTFWNSLDWSLVLEIAIGLTAAHVMTAVLRAIAKCLLSKLEGTADD